MQNTTELIGVLQAISIVASGLAVRLMRIEKDVREYESGILAGKSAGEKQKRRM